MERKEKKPEDTNCPIIFAGLLATGNSPKEILESESWAACLGPRCQMWSTILKACGLRTH